MLGITLSLSSVLLGSTAATALSIYSVVGEEPKLLHDHINGVYRIGGQTVSRSAAYNHSRLGNATMVDADGRIKWAPHNLITSSENLSATGTGWSRIGTTVLLVADATAPGATSGFVSQVTATAGTFRAVRADGGLANGNVGTLSVWLKAGTHRYVRMVMQSVSASASEGLSVDLQTGATIFSGPSFSTSVVSAGNGWYLCSITAAVTNSVANDAYITFCDASGVDLTTTGTETFFVSGVHLYRSDLGGMVNNPDRGDSYVPTTSAAVYMPRVGNHVYEDDALALGYDLTPDYWIDAASGNDSNAGTSEGAAWASLSKISGIALSSGATKTVRVKSGLYNTSADYAERSDASSGGPVGAGARLNVVFEAGCTMDGSSMAGSENGFEFSGAEAWTSYVYGNGLVVQNYVDAGATSPNGVGNRGNNTTYVYNVTVDGCEDGFSAHETASMYCYDCTATGNSKAAFVHVDTANANHYRCSFTGASGATLGIGALSDTASGYFEDCIFVPNSSGQAMSIQNGTFNKCQIGTTSARVAVTAAIAADISDSFINASFDANANISISNCYGLLSVRQRNGGNVTVENSVISGPASGISTVFYNNYDPGSGSPHVIRNNIFETATAAAFMAYDATNSGYVVAAGSQFHNNILSGSAAFDADLVTADTGATVIVGNVTADALIGAANTLDPDDYGYASGSPAIGAATDGGNCGFAIGEVEATADQQPVGAWVNKGLLLESAAATNLISHSQDFTNVAWTKTNAGTLAINAIGPDGQTSAVTLIDSAATGTGSVIADSPSVTCGSAVNHTISVYAKVGQLSWMRLSTRNFTTGDAEAWFDLANGAVGATAGGQRVTQGIESVGNGWYRCHLVFTPNAGDLVGNVRIVVGDANNDATVDLDGTSSILIYGAQFEAGSVPTSYIPTASATATRALETYTVAGASMPYPTPNVIGPELVTNGTFDTDVTGWNRGFNSVNGTFTSVSGSAVYTAGAGDGANPRFVATLSGCTVGGVYQIRYKPRTGTYSGDRAISWGANSNGTGSDIGRTSVWSDSTPEQVHYRVATSSTMYIAFATFGITAGQTVSVDNISVREIDPLAVSIQMDGTMTYADTGVTVEERFYEWGTGTDKVQTYLLTTGAATGQMIFNQIAASTGDTVASSSTLFAPGVNVPFSIAARHGSTFINGAVGGTALTADLTPVALANPTASSFLIAGTYTGNIGKVRVWDVDLGNAGIAEATT